MINYHIMTLFPEVIEAATNYSIVKRAKEAGLIRVQTHNIRDFSENKHKKVDDYPFGGGAGMVMTAQPIISCHNHIKTCCTDSTRTIYLSPKGRTFTQAVAQELLQYDHLILLCGHYEGIDQRALDRIVDEEISVGDYILTGGEIPALLIIEATSRLIEGVLSTPESHIKESFSDNLLEYPQYTRPQHVDEAGVPEVLLSGNHAAIEAWRFEQSIKITLDRRPELLDTSNFTKKQMEIYMKVLRERK